MTVLNKIMNLFISSRSEAVSGEISLTCNACQTNNTYGYSNVTGHWIGHIIRNKTSNGIMTPNRFARCYPAKIGEVFDIDKCHTRCLAHIINLGTQTLLSIQSKAKYSAHKGEHLPEPGAPDCNGVGFSWAIHVKEESSAQQKKLFDQFKPKMV
ncbi:hypothetical protein CPB83DRAFT_837075 [Crepidotus variabilis]|uniref:Uncharacterized protein n=1 Tax=Crepidotus variabilis TaxID=179855 RepID=A0A9P6JNF9_9AGAR|nr:hypothetical protein CPB83DRAFT_837075 [Crepidotus variabilis]